MGFLWVCIIFKKPFEVPYMLSAIVTATQGPFLWTSLKEFLGLCWECIKRWWHERTEAEGDSEEKEKITGLKEREGEPGEEEEKQKQLILHHIHKTSECFEFVYSYV
eukprot:TRINITY_DN9759_c0_g3_i1.p4 TRINITY_DN9759_c0_g3~~TRINITY_DN9759_c0_g3_i1.p4  ORF type:complete len:107 (+),score=8.72 TRINITY_DN9759_c0_g3_i1:646-966(+)